MKERIIHNRYIPHHGQVAFHNSKAKFRGIFSGVGFGKSAAGANEIIKNAIKYPKCIHLISAPNTKIVTHATLEQFWKFLPRDLLLGEKKSENTIFLVNGARIIYLTADNERHIDRLRGIEIGSFWADEAALYLALFWDVLLGRLRSPDGPLTGIVTTTPKGYNFLHSFFVKKQHPVSKKPLLKPEQYEWFGGSTEDNPYTPDEYKETLKAQYAGKFLEQEYYGKFVGFEGQVYDAFDEKLNIINKMPQMEDFKEFAVGIDWGFTNPMAAVIVGYDGDGRVYILEEYYRKRRKIKDLCDWLKWKQETYPFEMLYADPSEPANLAEMHEFGFSVVRARNMVMPGISAVYKRLPAAGDGKPRLFVYEKCVNLLDELNQYRYNALKENRPEKEEPLKVNDHLCFVKGTKVMTINGQQNIESLSHGDLILTRRGYENIDGLFRHDSKIWEVILSNGKKLYTTQDHPFWVKGLGYTKVCDLRKYYILETLSDNKWLKKSNIKESSIRNMNRINTSKQLSIYTNRNGLTNMVIYLKGIMSIIKIVIVKIMILITLNSWKQSSINQCTQKNISKSIKRKSWKTSRKPNGSLKSGINLKKEGNGIVRWLKILGRIGKESLKYVKSVSKSILTIQSNRMESFAVRNVNHKTEEIKRKIWSRNNVLFALRNFILVNIKTKKPVHIVAVQNTERIETVYNLTVHNTHEYYANGILVSNCDALRYVIYTHDFGGGFFMLDDKKGLVF